MESLLTDLQFAVDSLIKNSNQEWNLKTIKTRYGYENFLKEKFENSNILQTILQEFQKQLSNQLQQKIQVLLHKNNFLDLEIIQEQQVIQQNETQIFLEKNLWGIWINLFFIVLCIVLLFLEGNIFFIIFYLLVLLGLIINIFFFYMNRIAQQTKKIFIEACFSNEILSNFKENFFNFYDNAFHNIYNQLALQENQINEDSKLCIQLEQLEQKLLEQKLFYNEITEDYLSESSYKKIFDTLRANNCLLYTSPSPRDRQKYRMPSYA
eukprot:TRINITY_DN25812_c0_g1_i1.p2 TRINITY_DN25812_c0_g1~~TRINITY_DN25812_c0_g1_i1.p2  ORF type:complete len:266 (+),score=41.96 TRINITY_DN25812_c0_g1_i1:383-1180(+)